MAVYVVLNDGDTFSQLQGCKLVTVDDGKLKQDPEAEELLDNGNMAEFLKSESRSIVSVADLQRALEM